MSKRESYKDTNRHETYSVLMPDTTAPQESYQHYYTSGGQQDVSGGSICPAG